MFGRNSFYAIGVIAILFLGGLSLRQDREQPEKSLHANVTTNVEESNERVDFLFDYDEALTKARRENKPVLVFFMADNCRYSRQMLAHAFVDPDVERFSKSFVCLEIDVNEPSNDRICDAFGVVANPTVQFVTSYGVPLQRVTKLQSGADLLGQMQIALTSIAWRTAQEPDEGTILR